MNNNQRNPGFQSGQFNPQYNRLFGNGGYPQEMMPGYMPPPQMQPSYFKGRPVVSIEEARAAQIDFDGSLYIFTDLGKGKIYTKQINPDGTATLNTFVLAKEMDEGSQEYVTREEFKSALASIQAAMGAGVKEPVSVPPQKKINF